MLYYVATATVRLRSKSQYFYKRQPKCPEIKSIQRYDLILVIITAQT